MTVDDLRYDGRHAVVTGGSSGVGAALVARLAELGATRVTVLDRQPPAGAGDGVAYVEADLADPDAVDAAVDRIEGDVDVLFNNAGVAATLPTDVVMAVNVLAPSRLMRRLLPRMPPGGAVVNTASAAGGGFHQHLAQIVDLLAIEDWGAALAWVAEHPELTADPYAFSKECLQVLTLHAARATMARGVRLNAVCPGVIETPLLGDFKATISEPVLDWMTGQGNGRRATPQEVAAVLAFLGAPAAGYVHGVNVVVDGGFTAAMTVGQVDLATYPA